MRYLSFGHGAAVFMALNMARFRVRLLIGAALALGGMVFSDATVPEAAVGPASVECGAFVAPGASRCRLAP